MELSKRERQRSRSTRRKRRAAVRSERRFVAAAAAGLFAQALERSRGLLVWGGAADGAGQLIAQIDPRWICRGPQRLRESAMARALLLQRE